MFNFGWMELVLVLVIALVVFGPGKLPEVGRAVGRGLAEFKKAARDFEASADQELRRAESGRQIADGSGNGRPQASEAAQRAPGSAVGSDEKA